MKGALRQLQSRVLVERKLLSSPQKRALISYVLKKRKRDKEDESQNVLNEDPSDTRDHMSNDDRHGDNDDGGTLSTTVEEDGETHSDSTVVVGSNITATSTKGGKKDHDTLEDVNEQLKSLREKLEGLKKEKHQLFQELKKVIHEEDEKRQQKQLEQQKLYQSEQENTSVYNQSVEGSTTYRSDPRLGKRQQNWPSPSSGYTGYSDGGPSTGKIPRGSVHHDIPTQYNQQQQQQPSYEQDKFPSSPYLQQSRVPPQSHMVRPHAIGGSSSYPQYRGAGPGTHYGYTPPVNSNTPQYGGQPPYKGTGGVPTQQAGGYIQSPGPLPPPDVSGQMYHHQQQQYMSQGIMPREFQSHFTFEPHQQSRFMMRSASTQRPNHMKINPFSPQRDQGSSPSNSPNDRIRYLQQQQQRVKK